MIYDKIENIGRYPFDLGKILMNQSIDSFETGKKEIEGDNLFSIGLQYETKSSEEGLWEAHRKYLDIHIILEGEENIQVSDISSMLPTTEYVDDYQLFKGESSHVIHLVPGYFIILFPNEVHKTGILVGSACKVLKKVFKLKL